VAEEGAEEDQDRGDQQRDLDRGASEMDIEKSIWFL
jgi:hypothetical protein